MSEDQEPPTPQDVDSVAFEEAFRRLGEVAASLEEGGLTLAEATLRYEQGMRLVRRCNQLLDAAQLKITTLKDSYESPDSDPDSWESAGLDAPTAEKPESGPDAPRPTGPLLP